MTILKTSFVKKSFFNEAEKWKLLNENEIAARLMCALTA